MLATSDIRLRKRPTEKDHPSVLARKQETGLHSESVALFSNAVHLWYWQRRSFFCISCSSPHEASGQYRQSSLRDGKAFFGRRPCFCLSGWCSWHRMWNSSSAWVEYRWRSPWHGSVRAASTIRSWLTAFVSRQALCWRNRVHRVPQHPEAAAAELRRQVQAGLLDGDTLDCRIPSTHGSHHCGVPESPLPALLMQTLYYVAF